MNRKELKSFFSPQLRRDVEEAGDIRDRVDRVGEAFYQLAVQVDVNVPDSADKTASMRKLREAFHTLEDAIRLEGFVGGYVPRPQGGPSFTSTRLP